MPTYHLTLKHDTSAEGKAIFSNAVHKVKYHHIDVNAVARAARLTRTDIVKKLNQLNEHGHIELKTSGIEHRYLILKALPQTDREIEAVTDRLYADLQARETDALHRGRQVIDLITGRKCFARALAEHFGMDLPGGGASCGHCTFCLTATPITPPSWAPRRTTAGTIQRVLEATPVRDDPRFLARVAFGIKSPRVMMLNLDKSHVLASLVDHDFEDLLREFTKACQGRLRDFRLIDNRKSP
ncbi:hypothetical protein BDV26DRAFT_253448 [Aspergillus bertholletiae]|uniref:ATP-dependent DNA helicase RecQ zinc-binding domain-containing protein n=1 Tax=Aspergillus bertholletiae TaxID=1226010 RepID=A0A5N7BKV6_9EURO|nr:hypothetical protein BDV26DRAFT_253448 [Aspergillus bertholletiae]